MPPGLHVSFQEDENRVLLGRRHRLLGGDWKFSFALYRHQTVAVANNASRTKAFFG
jgi:hypothetical protein